RRVGRGAIRRALRAARGRGRGAAARPRADGGAGAAAGAAAAPAALAHRRTRRAADGRVRRRNDDRRRAAPARRRVGGAGRRRALVAGIGLAGLAALAACSEKHDAPVARGPGLETARLPAAEQAGAYDAAFRSAFDVGPALTLLLDTTLLPRSAGYAGGAPIA